MSVLAGDGDLWSEEQGNCNVDQPHSACVCMRAWVGGFKAPLPQCLLSPRFQFPASAPKANSPAPMAAASPGGGNVTETTTVLTGPMRYGPAGGAVGTREGGDDFHRWVSRPLLAGAELGP